MNSSKDIAEIKSDILATAYLKDKEERKQNVPTPAFHTGEVTEKREEFKKHFDNSINEMFFRKQIKDEDRVKTRGRHAGLHSLIREYLNENNIAIPYTNYELVKRALSVGDFGDLLANTVHRAIYSIYDGSMERMDYKMLVKERVCRDFREHYLGTVKSEQSLKPIVEGESISYQGETTAGDVVSLSRYAKGVCISFETMVNDDVGLISDILMKLPLEAMAYDEARFYDTLLNVTGLFSAANAPSAAIGLTNEGLNAAYTYFQDQTNLALKTRKKEDTELKLGLPLSAILVHPTNFTAIRQILRDISADEASNVTVFANMGIMTIISPYVDTNRWYAFSDPNRAPAIVKAVPDFGQPLMVDQKDNWDTRGFHVKVELLTGYGKNDARGIYRRNLS